MIRFALNTRRFILFFFNSGIIAALKYYGKRRIKLKSGMEKSSTLIYEVVQNHTNHVIRGSSCYLCRNFVEMGNSVFQELLNSGI